MAQAVRNAKADVVEAIKSNVEASSIVLFTDFKGLTVGEVTKLRRQLKADGASMKVFKNTLARRALAELNIEFPETFLIGPSGLIYSNGDPTKVAKTVVNFSKEAQNFAIKGGLYEKSALSEAKVKAFASLPGREELLAKVVGSIKAPLSGLVNSLSGPMRGLVYTLNSIKEKK